MSHESTPDRIAHGLAMLNTIELHMEQVSDINERVRFKQSIDLLRFAYYGIERAYERKEITDPHPRQVGTRILPRWEWWLHRIMKRLNLGGIEE